MKNRTDIMQHTELRTTLSPQQVQFVRLLEMNAPEFEQRVADELDNNPALENAEWSDEGSGSVAEDTKDDAHITSANEDDFDDDGDSAVLTGRRDANSVRPVWNEGRGTVSLLDALDEQLDIVDAPERDVAVAKYLVGYLDGNGRLSRSLRDIADDISISTGHPVDREDLVPALDIIRYQLDPPGLGATDLRECLLIQLKRREPKTLALRVATEIIRDYFDLFSLKHYDRIQSALGIDNDTLVAAIDTIRSLDPKPGAGFVDDVADKVSHITPDFYVAPVEGSPGRFTVSLNQYIPELAVEQSFLVDDINPEAALFKKSKRRDAQNFIALVRRRNTTLMAVMQAIVKLQRRFFETEDKADLRPMILNDVAELTGLDRSVISRATSGKYVATLANTYPLKIFFNDNPTDDPDGASSSEIFVRLQELIDNEDKHRPLSDRILTDLLNEQGYNIARRTVTKYREKNNIPVARLRKEYN